MSLSIIRKVTTRGHGKLFEILHIMAYGKSLQKSIQLVRKDVIFDAKTQERKFI